MNRLSRRKFLTASAALAAGAATRLARADDNPDPKAAPGSDLAAGNTRFGLELYGRLKDEAGNQFLSPFSISTALAMTAAGAKGATLEEMRKVLHLPPDPHPAFGELLKGLREQPPAGVRPKDAGRPGFELSIANAIWAQQGYPWRDEYKRLVAADYAAAANDVDFKSDPEKARATINQWVEKETKEKIRDLIPPRGVTPTTRMVLTNAIYFKAAWADLFLERATKDQPFHLADGTKVDVPLMYRVGRYPYAEADGYQLVEIPYASRRTGMVVVLPRKPDGLPAVEKELTADRLAADLKQLKPEPDVHLYLPRFRVEKPFQLGKTLQAMGMTSAFSDATADFTGMHTGGEKVALSEVVHKAFVDVNEKGTEAAAATAVMAFGAAPPGKPKEFRADRPFLFLIRDSQTNTVLFMGRLANPKG